MDIKLIRGKLDLTQKELANKLGVDPVTVSRWEIGKNKPSKLAEVQITKLLRRLEK